MASNQASNITLMSWLASVLAYQDSVGRGSLFWAPPGRRAQDGVGFALRLTQTEHKIAYLQRTTGTLGVWHWAHVSKGIGKRHVKMKQSESQEE